MNKKKINIEPLVGDLFHKKILEKIKKYTFDLTPPGIIIIEENIIERYSTNHFDDEEARNIFIGRVVKLQINEIKRDMITLMKLKEI